MSNQPRRIMDVGNSAQFETGEPFTEEITMQTKLPDNVAAIQKEVEARNQTQFDEELQNTKRELLEMLRFRSKSRDLTETETLTLELLAAEVGD